MAEVYEFKPILVILPTGGVDPPASKLPLKWGTDGFGVNEAIDVSSATEIANRLGLGNFAAGAAGSFLLGAGAGDSVYTAKSSIPLSGFGAAAADVSLGGFKLTNVADPVSSQDAVNLQTLLLYSAGVKDMKDSVRLATAAALAAYTPSGSPAGDVLTANANGALSIDGVAVAVNDRVLIKDETAGNAKYNGIYVVTQTGDGSNPYILTRADDFDTSAEVTNGAATFTGPSGSANPNRMYLLTTADPITLGTTSLTFTLFAVLPTVQAGSGLGESSGVLSVNVDNVGIEISGDTLQLKDAGVSNAKFRDSAGFSVVGKFNTGTGDVADIVAGADSVLGRSGSGDLAFGTIVTNQIGANQVTLAKLAAQAAATVLANATTGSAVPTAVALGAQQVLQADITGGALTARYPRNYVATTALTANAANRGTIQMGGVANSGKDTGTAQTVRDRLYAVLRAPDA